jgi:uncharacterized protein (DUF1697 family)
MIWVAWLRAVNVGGNNKVPMAELRALCGELGFTDVATYIQSGNVLLRSPLGREAVAERLREGIAARFGLSVPVVVRSGPELDHALAHHAFLGADAKELHFGFLADLPTPEAVASLDPARSPPAEFRVDGQDVYLRYPTGMGTTKLTADYFDRKLKTTLTARNWNTVTHMAGLAAALAR